METEKSLLLSKYLNDECTSEELVEVASFLSNPSMEEDLSMLLEKASQKFENNQGTSAAHKESGWRRLHSQISQTKPELTVSTWRKNGLRIAASVLMVLGIVWVLEYSDLLSKENQQQSHSIKTVSNDLGEKSKLTLPDGSVVILNSGTSVSYPEKFGTQERYIVLSGEAYFDVKKDPNRPLVVEAKGVKTKVLGTSFNIRAYDFYNSVKVSLRTGKIALQLSGGEDELLLAPGQEVLYDLLENTYELSEFDEKAVLGWQSGIISLDHMTEDEVINMLEHWYAVRIKTQGTPKNDWQKLKANFDNEPLENVLNSLGYTIEFDYHIEGKDITIKYN